VIAQVVIDVAIDGISVVAVVLAQPDQGQRGIVDLVARSVQVDKGAGQQAALGVEVIAAEIQRNGPLPLETRRNSGWSA
jgi:hypothetical protein